MAGMAGGTSTIDVGSVFRAGTDASDVNVVTIWARPEREGSAADTATGGDVARLASVGPGAVVEAGGGIAEVEGVLGEV